MENFCLMIVYILAAYFVLLFIEKAIFSIWKWKPKEEAVNSSDNTNKTEEF